MDTIYIIEYFGLQLKILEDPKELLKEFQHLVFQLESIIQKINKTNSSVFFSEEQTISDALAKRDMIGLHRNVLIEVIEHASVQQDRYSQSEIKFYPTIDIALLLIILFGN